MLKLEVGKFYKTRDGNKRGPLVYFPEFGDKPYGTMRDEWWSEDGLRAGSDGTDGKDLIAEWQEVAMETGTLKELNVKPGDVVILDGLSCAVPMTVGDDMIARGHDGSRMEVAASCDPEWRIISRATQTPDLTAITTPFGLLDEATQEALRAHGGPYERFSVSGWIVAGEPCKNGATVYRVKPNPEVSTVTEDMNMAETGALYFSNGPDATPVRVTFNRINGVIDLASYKVEPR